MVLHAVSRLLTEPEPRGFMPFPALKNRILNLHKVESTLVTMSLDQRRLVFIKAIESGALDTIAFMLFESLCDENTVGEGDSICLKSDVVQATSFLVFYTQLFPKVNFRSEVAWRFPSFGDESITTLEKAIVACDPMAALRVLIFLPRSEGLSDREKAALKSIRCDEMRHFFVRLLCDFLSDACMVQIWGVAGPYDVNGMVVVV